MSSRYQFNNYNNKFNKNIRAHFSHLTNLSIMMLIILFVLSLCTSPATCEENVTLSIAQTSLEAYPGNSVTIICNGTNLLTDDIVWQYFPSGNSTFFKVIYIYGQLVNAFQTKYRVHSYQASSAEVVTSLTISDLTAKDAEYQYQCACNIYTACASGFKAKAEANVIALEATTTTVQTEILLSSNLVCEEIAFNSVQFIFLFLDMFCLVSICYVMVYQFHTTKLFFKIAILSMALLVLVSLIVMIILWMKPAGQFSYNSLVIVCVGLLPCFVCMGIIYSYCVQLWQEDRLRLSHILLISLDLVLETLAAGLLIAANGVCGTSYLTPVKFNYAYLEIIGSCFLFIFGALLIFKVFIFVIIKHEKNSFFVMSRNFVTNLQKNKLKVENLA